MVRFRSFVMHCFTLVFSLTGCDFGAKQRSTGDYDDYETFLLRQHIRICVSMFQRCNRGCVASDLDDGFRHLSHWRHRVCVLAWTSILRRLEPAE